MILEKELTINIGDTVFAYCRSSPYMIFSGKVVEVEKRQILKRGKIVEIVRGCKLRRDGYYYGACEIFLTEKEAALACLVAQQEYKKTLLQQVKCCDDSIKNMNEILERSSDGKEESEVKK